jgi:hypothetical protein
MREDSLGGLAIAAVILLDRGGEGTGIVRSDAGRQDQRHRPDSRNLKTPRGYMQGYNAQAVCNDRQIVVAAEISVASPDFGQLEPLIAAAERELVKDGEYSPLATMGIPRLVGGR